VRKQPAHGPGIAGLRSITTTGTASRNSGLRGLPSVNRVVLDVASKPPCTMKRE
jgi:GMP synthase PP-ATPase subunit